MTIAALTADVVNILLIVLIVYVFALGIIAVKGFAKERMLRKRSIWFASVLGFLFMVYLIPHVLADLNILADLHVFSDLRNIFPSDWTQIFLVLGLVTVTGFYVLMAFRQANASTRMAKEMRNARYDTVRPVIDIQREPGDEDKLSEAVAGKSGDTSRGLACVLRNIGLGPAIDMYSFVQNPFVQNPSDRRQRFDFGTLAVEGKTEEMKLSLNQDDKRTALVAYYKDVYGRTLESSREVKSDEVKGWQLGPLQTRLMGEDKK